MIHPGFETEATEGECMRRYPRLTAHIICQSLGYATPSLAARIISDAKAGRKSYCEWASACFNNDPKAIIKAAFRNRHYHYGFMSHYPAARALLERAITASREPLFASWF